jgi:hypothetical protein
MRLSPGCPPRTRGAFSRFRLCYLNKFWTSNRRKVATVHDPKLPLKVVSQVKAGGKETNRAETLEIASTVKVGDLPMNHNEGLKVRTSVVGGRIAWNHNQSLNVRSSVKSGAIAWNHNEGMK